MQQPMLDLSYGADPLQKADIYLPDHPNDAAVILVHGGGWLRGDKANEQDLGQLLADAGYVTAIPNYRLAPAALFPAAQSDLDAFGEWFDQSAFTFDRARVGLLGHSVGGTMALTNSLTTGRPVVAWSAIVDFANWLQQHQNVKAALDAEAELGITDRHEKQAAFYKYFIQNYLGELTPEKLTAVNPEAQLNTTLGPTLLYNATDELAPLSGALRFLEQAAGFGRDTALHVVPGTGHAREYADFSWDGTLAFFQYHLQA